ncbi:hypothetical protein ACTJKO_00500 [Curtobacterium sp. 22159]|uniref:hypothetical protein n=1 Tax=Curtobacterium sp. 22159 TaxID=3453882 RepID=UPI003F83BF52
MATELVTPVIVNALVESSRLPVATSTCALVRSSTGNDRFVADDRDPVRFVVDGPVGSALYQPSTSTW